MCKKYPFNSMADSFRKLSSRTSIPTTRFTPRLMIDDIEGETEWGAHAWKRPYYGVLALIDESPEHDLGNPQTGAKAPATCPSRKGLVTILNMQAFAGGVHRPSPRRL